MRQSPQRRLLSKAEYENLCREACENPLGLHRYTLRNGKPVAEHYWFTIWYRVANHIGLEDPMLPPRPLPQTSDSDIEHLRAEVQRLVDKYQSESFDTLATPGKYVDGALKRNQTDSAQ